MRASSAGVSVLASCPACLLNSPASRSSRNRLLQRSINTSLQSSLSRIAAQVWSASSSNISRARRASSARPLRLATRWLSSIRSASVSTMVFSMNTIILPFQLLQYTRHASHKLEPMVILPNTRLFLANLFCWRTVCCYLVLRTYSSNYGWCPIAESSIRQFRRFCVFKARKDEPQLAFDLFSVRDLHQRLLRQPNLRGLVCVYGSLHRRESIFCLSPIVDCHADLVVRSCLIRCYPQICFSNSRLTSPCARYLAAS